MELSRGDYLERYRIETVLGTGGMAIVYKALHDTLGSAHAIKILLVPDESVKQRLLQEGRTQARLVHPNLVRVTDVIEVQGAPALVMEYIDGPSLEEWLKLYRPSLGEAAALFRGICRGIAAAHRANSVHRDLKTANVMLQETDGGVIPKVTDFGLVKVLEGDGDRPITRTGMGMGTPHYMAPEQIRDASSVDERADIFALGCILYELVTGKRPFDGPDTFSVFNAVVRGKYTPPQELVPDLPMVISTTIASMLSTKRKDRPGSCDEVLELLFGGDNDNVGEDMVVPVRPDGLRSPQGRHDPSAWDRQMLEELSRLTNSSNSLVDEDITEPLAESELSTQPQPPSASEAEEITRPPSVPQPPARVSNPSFGSGAFPAPEDDRMWALMVGGGSAAITLALVTVVAVVVLYYLL